MRKKHAPLPAQGAPAAPASVPAPIATPAAPVVAVPAVRAIPELATPGRKPLIRKTS
jgi:hypothetical protein